MSLANDGGATAAPRVFLSATDDLESYRRAVSDALRTLGLEPTGLEAWPTDERGARELLRSKIADCETVICLIGPTYGREPAQREENRPRRSYGQLCYETARELKQPLLLCIATEACPLDQRMVEDEALQQLQAAWREELQAAEEPVFTFVSAGELIQRLNSLRPGMSSKPPVAPGATASCEVAQPRRRCGFVSTLKAAALVAAGVWLLWMIGSAFMHSARMRHQLVGERQNQDRLTVNALIELGDAILVPGPGSPRVVGESDSENTLERARIYYEQARARAQQGVDEDPTSNNQKDLFRSIQRLGIVNRQLGRLEQAADCFQANLENSRQRLSLSSDDTEARSDLGSTYHDLGCISLDLRNLAQAEDYYQKSLVERVQLVAEAPGDEEVQYHLADCYTSLGKVSSYQGKPAQARKYLQAALDIRRELVVWFPHHETNRQFLTELLRQLANAEKAEGNVAQALVYCEEALAIDQKLAEDAPDDPLHEQQLASDWGVLGDLRLMQGDTAAALPLLKRALVVFENDAVDHPTNVIAQLICVKSYCRLAEARLQQGETMEAEQCFLNAIQVLNQQSMLDSDSIEVPYTRFDCYLRLGRLRMARGAFNEGQEAFLKALSHQPQLVDIDPTTELYPRDLANLTGWLSQSHLLLDDPAQALRYAEEAQTLTQQLADANPGDVDLQRELARCQFNLGAVDHYHGRYDESIARFERGLEILQQVYASGQHDEVGEDIVEFERRILLSKGARTATGDLDNLLEKQPQLLREYLLIRCAEFARIGRCADALTAAEELSKLDARTHRHLYVVASDLARYLKRFSGADRELTPDEQADQSRLTTAALKYLRMAIESGFDGLEDLEESRDLDSLRELPAFQELVEELQARKLQDLKTTEPKSGDCGSRTDRSKAS